MMRQLPVLCLVLGLQAPASAAAAAVGGDPCSALQLPTARATLLENSKLSEADASSQNASIDAQSVAAFGCVRVERFEVDNRCGRDLFLKGWDITLRPGKTSVTSWRNHDVQRLSWRFADGPWDYDIVELNTNWHGAGSDFCAHPNYATWYGFSTSSRYEALDPHTGALACADPGAEVTFTKASCPPGLLTGDHPGSRLTCDFRATQASIRDCRSTAALYQRARTWTINGDGSRSHRFACGRHEYHEWCGIWANYPCAPESHNWPGYRVGSWIDCTNRRKSITLKLSVCIK